MMELPSAFLECQVCLEPGYPPIYQCPGGHIVCSSCKPNVKTCPTCRENMGNIRALAVEQMAAPFQLPCRYHLMGCTGVYRYDSKLKHEQQCNFRPFICPYSGEPCPVIGDLDTLIQHLQHDHESAIHCGALIERVFRHNLPFGGKNLTYKINIYEFNGEHFCHHFEVFNSPSDMVYMTFVTFMGNEEDAMKFSYSLEIQNGNKQLIWKGTPRSIRDGGTRIRDNHDGLVIHQTVAQLFADANSETELVLRVKGEIWKEGI